MSGEGLFSEKNIYKIVIAIIILALGYMFNMILDTRHLLYLSGEAQEQNVRQWQKISKQGLRLREVVTDVEWLKKGVRVEYEGH